MFNGLEFQNPWILLLLLIIPFIIIWQKVYQNKSIPTIRYSQYEPFEHIEKTWKVRILVLPYVIRYIAIALLIVVVAKPLTSLSKEDMNKEGIDIIMAIDISSSMLAEDFKPNRLEAAKGVANKFVEGRKSDNIGVVLFSGESFTQCPPTTDHKILLEMLSLVKSGMIQDGTAIGDGLATAVNRIKDTKTKSKVIILLTDGVNTMGAIDPLTAADIARDKNIRVYTIGVGRMGIAPYPVKTPFGKQYQNVEVEIDEGLLKEIADVTGGKYFRSTNEATLLTIFNEIDKMEKTIIEHMYSSQKKEQAFPLLILALILLILEFVIRRTILKTNP